jgi:hypothetical protein
MLVLLLKLEMSNTTQSELMLKFPILRLRGMVRFSLGAHYLKLDTPSSNALDSSRLQLDTSLFGQGVMKLVDLSEIASLSAI